MYRTFRYGLLLSSAAVATVAACQDSYAQTALPEVNVTVASPIVRRTPPPVRRPAPAPTPAAAPAPAPVEPAPATEVSLPGTLPVVTDQFATVTVVPNGELRRNGANTLGDLLFEKPGITGSEFAPGASSRPVIRGLDVNRVGIVENGIGGTGASDLGEDHAVPIAPLTTNQVEVVRGPATLRYGSQSIGGVVSATNNRIPDALPCAGAAPIGVPPLLTKAPAATSDPYGAPPLLTKAPAGPSTPPGCVTFETRTGFTTVNNGPEGAQLIDAGYGNWAAHADVFGSKSDDYRIPSYPYLVPPDPVTAPRATQPFAFNGRQPNSAARADGGSVGGSYVFQDGFAGIAVSQYNALYHIPGIDGENNDTHIDLHQTKVESKGEYRPQSAAIDTIRFWLGATDYKHNEIGLADPADPNSTEGVRQTFINKEQEGRAEVTLMPLDLRFASLTTAIGAQGGHQKLDAPSPDDPDSPLNGLFSLNTNSRVAGYMFNEFKFSDVTKAQVAGRIEHIKLNGTVPAFIPDVFDVSVDPTSIGPTTERSLQFTPKSASVGLIQNLPWDLVGSVTAQRVERAPKPAELFSRGAHDATATFDIGNPDLKIEVAKSIEAGLRRAAGPFRFELTGYYTRFDGFIFRNLTGNTCDSQACVAFDDPNPLELNQARYDQRDATFRGGEFQSQLDLFPLWTGMFGIEDQFDIVRATFTDGTNVPRIPPVRVGGGVFWRDANWLVRLNLLHAFAHTETEVTPMYAETPTGGYNDLKFELSYNKKFEGVPFGNVRELTVGLRGQNLLNDDIRNSVSYNKDEVLLPGASVRLFANVKF